MEYVVLYASRNEMMVSNTDLFKFIINKAF